MSETQATPPARPQEPARPRAPSDPAQSAPRGRRGGGGDELDPTAWMVTFSDLLTLLMTFFVLIFASQDPVPPEKLQEAFGQQTGVFSQFRTGFLDRISVVQRRDLNQDLVQVFLNEIGALDIEVQQTPEGLVITLPTDAYFEPGSARVNERARKRIDQLAAFLVVTRHRIRVEGHTDDRERVEPPYPGTWELSLARAHRVLLRLIALKIDEDRLGLAGYGPTRPRFANTSRVGRERNRRVDLVILNRRPGPSTQPEP